MSLGKATCEAAFEIPVLAGGEVPKSVHLLPLGDVIARDGRRWKLSDAASVVAATKAYANGAPVAVDYDHQLINAKDNGRPAPAAGWMMDFDVRADGIWASVGWTMGAAAMLAAKEYRFISPVFNYDKASGEILTIINAGLTNAPALTLTALASAEDIMATDKDLPTQLRPLLDLPDTATADAIVEAVRSLRGRAAASASPEQFVPVAALEAVTGELNRLKRGVSLDAATMAVDREIETGRLVPMLKAWAVDLCTINKPAFDAFVERTGGQMKHLFEPSAAAAALPHQVSAAESDTRSEIARNLGHAPAKKA
jgi:phage I-like protein